MRGSHSVTSMGAIVTRVRVATLPRLTPMEFGASARGTRSGLLWLLAGCLTLTTLPAQAAEERDAGESPASEQVTRETNASANPGNGHGSGSGAVFVDPAGLLLFGPTVGAELGFGHLSAGLYGRWLDGGVVARELFVDQEGESFAFSYGIGLRGRYYLDADLRGLFGGLAIEYLRTRLENESARIVTTNQLLVPQLEADIDTALAASFWAVAPLLATPCSSQARSTISLGGPTRTSSNPKTRAPFTGPC